MSQRPVRVAVLIAMIALTSVLSGMIAPYAEGETEVNLARGKSYTKSVAPNAQPPEYGGLYYEDTNDREATDGIVRGYGGIEFGYFQPETDFWLDITVDLERQARVHRARLSTWYEYNDYYSAHYVQVFGSTTGQFRGEEVELGHAGNANAAMGVRGTPSLTVDFEPASFRYIRFHINRYCGAWPSFTDWLFVSEVEVIGEIDTACPTTSLSTDPTSPNGANGWYITTPSIVLTADEPGTTYYQWDSTDPLGWQVYSGPLVAPEGVHSLNYHSTDAADNTEVTKSLSLKVDTITPTVNVASPAAEATVSDSAAITGEASDVNFASYSVSYGSGKRPLGDGSPGSWYQGTSWRPLMSSTSQVAGGTLATWSTAALDNSWHTVRVIALDQAGNVTTLLRPVKVGNPGRPWLDEVTLDSFDVAPEMSPDGSKVAFMSDRLGNMDIWVSSADGTNPAPLTTSPTRDLHPSFSPDGSQIVFASERSGNFDIWRMNADGTEAVQVTTGPYVDTAPTWSADGAKIAFERRTSPIPDVYVMNADGTNIRPIATSSWTEKEPVLSPDGSKIAFVSDADPTTHHLHLWVADSDGTGAHPITSLPDWRYVPGGIGHPSFSPDGTELVFNSALSGQSDIWRINVDGTNPRKLTTNPMHDGGPSCSRDGAKIVFNSSRSGFVDIYSMNADGTNQTRLTQSVDDFIPDVNRNSSMIAFTSNRARGYAQITYANHVGDIFVVNSDGTGIRAATDLSFYSYHPSFSPDGSQLAFTSNRAGTRDVWKMNVDGSGAGRLTSADASESVPTWGPGGKIVYTSDEAGDDDIWSMADDGSGKTRLTTSALVERYPDINPAGTRIAFSASAGAASQGWDDLYIMNTDGSGLRQLTNDPAALEWHASFSPGGNRISYVKSNDLYTMKTDGTDSIRLTYDAAVDNVQTWGADGSTMVFSTSRTTGSGASKSIWKATLGPEFNPPNEPPVVEAGPDQTADEGSLVAIEARFGEGGVDDAQDCLIDWGDGTIEPGTMTIAPDGGTVTGCHVYADNGSYTVKVTVTDDNGGAGSDALTVMVNNVAPDITHFDPGSDPFEGQVASASARFEDAGAADTHAARIDWGDGTPVSFFDVATSPLPASHAYADDGVYTVSVTITDDDGGEDAGQFQITVRNAAPVVEAGPDRTVDEGDVLVMESTYFDQGAADHHVAAIDWGDGTPVSFFDVAVGRIQHPHVYEEEGIYLVTVSVTDNAGASGFDTAVVVVNHVNHPPTAEDLSVSTEEDVAVAVNLAASDPDGDSLAYTVSGGPAHGALAGEAPDLTYTPDLNYNQGDSFAYTVDDGNGGTAQATVTIHITPVNDPPIVDPIADIAIDENSPMSISVSAHDPDGDTLTLLATQMPGFATFEDNGDGTGILSLAPGFDDAGEYVFGVSASDGQASADGSSRITVSNVNRAPVADDLTIALDEDTPTDITLLGSDPDSDDLVYAIATNPSQGIVLGSGPVVTYHPLLDSNGIDAFTYVVADPSGATDIGVVSLTINAVNDSCAAADDAATTAEDNPVAIDVLANDTDADGDALAVASTTQGAHGSVSIGDGGILTYTPDSDYNGEDSFIYVVTDGHGGSGTGQVAVTINPVNDPPTADAGADKSANEGSVVTLAGSGADIDGDALTYGWTQISGPPVELVSPQAATASFTAPEVQADTVFVFELAVSDGQAGASDQVAITVCDVPPIAYERARSKGYWKNHAQHLAQALAKGSIDLGDTLVTTVSQAVSILADANTKDARYMLRAQLLATQLNLRNGSNPNAPGHDIRPVATKAKAFLAAHPNPVGATSADRAACIALKDALDVYNNSGE